MLGGDAAYGGNARVLTPFRSANKGSAADVFNFIHSSHRTTIERCFGILVRRWGILWRPLRFSVRRNNALLLALCRLHNICMQRHSQDQREMCEVDINDEGIQPKSTAAVVKQHCGQFVRMMLGQHEDAEAKELREAMAVTMLQAGCYRP